MRFRDTGSDIAPGRDACAVVVQASCAVLLRYIIPLASRYLILFRCHVLWRENLESALTQTTQQDGL
jgi:hypothetical protein